MNKLSQTFIFNDVIKKYPALKSMLNYNILEKYSYKQEDYSHHFHSISIKKYPLTPIILKLAKDNRIRLFNFSDPKDITDKSAIMPSSIMGFAITDPSNVKETISYVNAIARANYTRNRTTGQVELLKLDDLSLYAYLQMGAAAYIVKKHDAELTNNTQFTSGLAEVYSNMVCKTIDKQYPISGQYTDYDVLKFLTAIFFLQVMVGYETDKAVSTAFLMKNIDKKEILENCKTLGEDNIEMETILDYFKTIEEEFNFIKKDSITFRSLASGFSSMYGGTSLLAIEYFQYFLNMLLSVSCGANLFNDKMVKQMYPIKIGQDITKILAQVSSI